MRLGLLHRHLPLAPLLIVTLLALAAASTPAPAPAAFAGLARLPLGLRLLQGFLALLGTRVLRFNPRFRPVWTLWTVLAFWTLLTLALLLPAVWVAALRSALTALLATPATLGIRAVTPMLAPRLTTLRARALAAL